MPRRRHALAAPFLVAVLVPALACVRGAAAPAAARAAPPLELRAVALTDLHGHLLPERGLGGAPALGAAVRRARAGYEGRFLLLSAGDLVGASPAISGLLQDEPTVAFVDGLANARCRPLEPERRSDPDALAYDPGCDVVGTLGNHELDEGLPELVRLLRGGNHARGPFLEDPWRGASWPTVSANVVERATGRRPFPPFVVREVGGVRVGVVGALTRTAPQLLLPSVAGTLEVGDEADAINAAVRSLRALGARAIIVLLHEGGDQQGYPGWTRRDAPAPEGEVVRIVARLDPEVDVVVAGHTHRFVNAWLPNAVGTPVLVVEPLSAGKALATVDLRVDPASGDVVSARAAIEEVPANGPADPEAAALVARAQARIEPLVARVVGESAAPLAAAAGSAGESRLGDLVADALRAAAGTDVALVNPGSLRADLAAGPVTWGALYAVEPFGNDIVALSLTGAQLLEILEQQWRGARSRPLQVSGLAYGWDPARPPGARVVWARVGGRPVEAAARYTVAAPSFLAEGGDGFSALAREPARRVGVTDVEALEAHIARLPRPFPPPVGGRIVRETSAGAPARSR